MGVYMGIIPHSPLSTNKSIKRFQFRVPRSAQGLVVWSRIEGLGLGGLGIRISVLGLRI